MYNCWFLLVFFCVNYLQIFKDIFFFISNCVNVLTEEICLKIGFLLLGP